MATTRDRVRRAKKGAAVPAPADSPHPEQRAFLAALATTGVVTTAAKAAGIGRASAYRWREDCPEFAAAWREAMEEAADALEAEARTRALDGLVEPVLHQGRPVTAWVDAQGQYVLPDAEGARPVILTRRVVSDTLLIFLLKGARPEKFRDRHDHRHSGLEGGPVEVEEDGWSYEELRKLDPAELVKRYQQQIRKSGLPGPPGRYPGTGD